MMRDKRNAGPFVAGLICGLLLIGVIVPFADRGSGPQEAMAGGGGPNGSSPFGTGPQSRGGGFDDLTGPGGGLGGTGGGTPGASAPSVSGAANGDSPLATNEQVPTSAPGGVEPDAVAGGGRTDVGITDDQIRVGVLLADLGGLGDAGFAVSLGDEKAIYDAYFREINDAGGIAGRSVVPTYITFDPLDEDDMRRACLVATEDVKVFATFNLVGFYGAAVLCITQEHATPHFTYSGEPREWHRRSGQNFVSFAMAKDRILANLAYELDRTGLLEDAVIGTVEGSLPAARLATAGFVDTARSLGYEIEVRAELSSDLAESQAQIPVAVQQMQAAGVTHVVLMNNFVNSTLFVQQAEKRLFFPQYFHSDHANGSADGATNQMPESYDGAVAATATTVGQSRVGVPQPAVEADCEKRLEANGGPDITYGNPDDDNYSAVLHCTMIDTFATALRAAGDVLTRPAMTSKIAQRGPFSAGGLLAAAFRPDKFDAADAVRLVQWNYEREGARCRCWIPLNEPRAPRV